MYSYVATLYISAHDMGRILIDLALKCIAICVSSSVYMNQQTMTHKSNIVSIDYRVPIVIRSFIRKCNVALERYIPYPLAIMIAAETATCVKAEMII